MARQRDYESLARLKKQKKQLEKRAEALDKKIKEKTNQILSSNPSKEISTKYGILQYQERGNYEIPDNEELMSVASISQKMFNKIAKVNYGDLKKLLGEEEMNKLVLGRIVYLKNMSQFYKFTEFPKS